MPSAASAAPPETVWVEDLTLHPSGPAELGMVYDFIAPESGVVGGEFDIVTLRTAVGFDRAPMDWYPSIGFMQAGPEGSRLHHVGLRARYRLAGSPSDARLALSFRYRAMLAGEHEHYVQQQLAGRWRSGKLRVAWDLGLAEQFGDQNHVEARASAAVGVSVLIEMLHASVEVFTLVPLVGERLSDAGLGPDRYDPALYVGPSMRMNLEYLWISGSVVTGRIVGGGSPLMVRVLVGTQF